MKKWLVFIFILIFTMIASACRSADSLSKEEVIAEVNQQISQVENYQTTAELSIVVTDVASENMIESDEGSMKADIIEPTLESSGEMTDATGTKKYYSTNDAFYVQMNGDPWQVGAENDQPLNNDFSFYKIIAQIIIDVEDEEDVQMEEDDNSYIFTFSGKSESIYKAFEDPFALSLTGATPDEMQQDMMIAVDKETFYVQQVKNSFAVEKGGDKLVISVEQAYDHINEIDEISIPEEVIVEVSTENAYGSDETEHETDQGEKVDVITRVEERIDEIESYYIDASLTINIVNLTTNETEDNSQAMEQVDVIEEPMQSSGIIVEDDVTQQYYSTPDATYVQLDDQPWEDYSDQADQYDHSNMLYKDVAQILIEFKEEADVKMIEKDGTYVFTFSGKSESIYYAFEAPYSLRLTGATPDEMEQDMTITIDRDTHVIKHIENFFTVEKDGYELSILIDHSYKQINEINEISIPQEVIDEAI